MKKYLTRALALAAFLVGTAFVIPHNAPLHVASNAELTNLSTLASGTVIRDGFTKAGDTAPMLYTASAVVCPLNTGNGDNGSQVKSANGLCWLAAMPASVFDVTEFGADPTNTVSSTTAFNSTFAAAIAKSGTVLIPPGDYTVGGVTGSFTAQPQSLKVQGAGQGQSRLHCTSGPCLSISYLGMQNATHIDGLGLCATTTNINGIVLQNLNAVPNSFYDQEVNTVTNVTFQGCDGPQQTDYFGNALMTIGVDAVNLTYAQVYASSTSLGNGWLIQGYQVTGAVSATTTTSSNVLTFSPAAPAGVYAGMQVYDQTTGLFVGTVSTVGTTTVTLVANAANTVTSADTVQFFNQAFIYTASNDNFNGTAAGIVYGGGSQGLFVTQSNFAGTQGVIAPGNAFGLTQLTVTNSQFNTTQEDIDTGSLVTDVVISGNVFYVTDNTGTHPALIFNKVARLSVTGNVFTDNHSGGTAPGAISIVNDSTEGGSLVGDQFYGFGQAVSLGASTSGITAGPNSFVGTTTRYIDGGTSNLLFDSGTWTPGMTTNGTAGTPAYSTHVGSYEINGKLVVAHFNISTSGWTGSPTGSLLMTGLPFTSGSSEIGACYFEQWGGPILGSGYTFLGAQVPVNSTQPLLVESGSAIASNSVAIGAATAMTLFGFCEYHR